MQNLRFDGTWKEIWTQKGAVAGTKEDALEIGGWTNTVSSAREIAKRLVDFLEIKQSDKVLEIGCGAGGLAQYMDCDYIGIDYSKTSVKRCMEFFQKTAIYAEAADLPFRDKYFDKCFAYGCFFYFPNMDYVKRTVDEMKRVTKGMIFIGELPIKSHESKHLLFKKEAMQELGLTIIDGWAEPFTSIRFSAYSDNNT